MRNFGGRGIISHRLMEMMNTEDGGMNMKNISAALLSAFFAVAITRNSQALGGTRAEGEIIEPSNLSMPLSPASIFDASGIQFESLPNEGANALNPNLLLPEAEVKARPETPSAAAFAKKPDESETPTVEAKNGATANSKMPESPRKESAHLNRLARRLPNERTRQADGESAALEQSKKFDGLQEGAALAEAEMVTGGSRSSNKSKNIIPKGRGVGHLFRLKTGDFIYVDYSKARFTSYEAYFRVFIGKPGNMVKAKITGAHVLRDGGTTTIMTSEGTLYVPSALKTGEQPTWRGVAIEGISPDAVMISRLGVYPKSGNEGESAPQAARLTPLSFRKMASTPEKKPTQFGAYIEHSVDIDTLRALVAPYGPKDTIVMRNPQGRNYFGSTLKDVGALQQVVFALLAKRGVSLILVGEKTAKSIIAKAAKNMPEPPPYQTQAEIDYPIQTFLWLDKKAQDIEVAHGWTDDKMTAAQLLQTFKEAVMSYKQERANQAPSSYAFNFSVYAQGQFMRVLKAGAAVSATSSEMMEKTKPKLANFFNIMQQFNSLEVRKIQVKNEADKEVKALAR